LWLHEPIKAVSLGEKLGIRMDHNSSEQDQLRQNSVNAIKSQFTAQQIEEISTWQSFSGLDIE